MRKVAFVFPGQGSQMVGMGHDLFQVSPRARQVFEEADETLGFSLSRLCFGGPEDKLRQTVNTQPAVMTASLACLRAAFGEGNGIQPALWNGSFTGPAFVAGHSLGEYTALVAAGVLSFSDGIRLVQERARLMQEAGEKRPGGMAAIIGLDLISLEEVCQETGTEIANINSPEQTVISGTNNGLAWAMDLAKARGARRVIRLDVSGGFHSFLMQSAVKGLARAASQFDFSNPLVPLVANTTAYPASTAEEVRSGILRQVCGCVHWQSSIEYMIDVGVSTFIEIGPGRVLTGLIKRISKDVEVLNISDVDSLVAGSGFWDSQFKGYGADQLTVNREP
ncbi:MAG: Malonyl CoA-acyl carrier protein transacylase [Dehalococcoidia bacterium]|nr:Malonyl CoA-acyl carrier protein transacylase [Chloroflexota bacterium]